jgi:hypothetical protein
LSNAAAIYEKLAAGGDDAERSGAWVRLARVYRKMKDPDSGLADLRPPSDVVNVSVSGLPGDLISREGRASVFKETGRTEELRKEAEGFQSDLQRGRWKLTKAQYEFYFAEAESWLGERSSKPDRDSIARAEAVDWLWTNRNSGGAQSVVWWMLRETCVRNIACKHRMGLTAIHCRTVLLGFALP